MACHFSAPFPDIGRHGYRYFKGFSLADVFVKDHPYTVTFISDDCYRVLSFRFQNYDVSLRSGYKEAITLSEAKE